MVSTAAAGVLVAGCEVGPNFHRPNVVTPAAYTEAHTGPTSQPSPTRNLAVWWETFRDPELNSLVSRAIDGNLTLQIAEARVWQARAQQGATIANLFPVVSFIGSATRSKSSSNIVEGVAPTGVAATGFGIGTASSHSYPLYSGALDATWQLDFWGGLRRAAEAAGDSLEAEVDARRYALVTLMSQVATAYITLRGDQQQLLLTFSNLKTQQDSLDLTRSRFRAGLDSDLDVAQAQFDVANTAAQIPALELQIKTQIHAISVLLGQEPGALAAELGKETPIPPAPNEIPVGLPSELLRRRPDILEAEYNLASTTANIGVQVNQLFPQFSLTGEFGREATKLHMVDYGSSNFYSIGPTVSWNVFNSNQLVNLVRVANAEQRQALLTYKQTVLTGLQQVDDALVAFAQDQNHTKALADAVAADQRAVDLSTELYTRGLGDFLNVLTAEQSLFAAQLSLAQSQTTVSTDLVNLYVALGGGWDQQHEEQFQKREDPKQKITLD